MARMSFGLRGGFWPTSLPLFHASRLVLVSMTDSVVVEQNLNFRPNFGLAAFGQGAIVAQSARSCHSHPDEAGHSNDISTPLAVERVGIVAEIFSSTAVLPTIF